MEQLRKDKDQELRDLHKLLEETRSSMQMEIDELRITITTKDGELLSQKAEIISLSGELDKFKDIE